MNFASILSLILTLFIACAPAKAPVQDEYTVPFPSFRIADNLYYVGTKGVASYLITTREGHILINSNVEAGVPLLRTTVATPIAIARIGGILDDALAVRKVIHGVLVDILGLGVLITGESGMGKSECAAAAHCIRRRPPPA